MSSTRSPSPPEPLTSADKPDYGGEGVSLIVVGHGTGTQAGDAPLHHLVANLADANAFATVRAAVLNGDPSLAEAHSRLSTNNVQILPFMMSDGLTFRRRLAEAVDFVSWTKKPVVHPPLGLNSGLAPLLADRAKKAAAKLSWQPSDSYLLVIGHGSLRDDASARAAQKHQAAIAATGAFAGVEVAFLDQPPQLDEVLSRHAGPLLGVGLYAGEGRHGANDMIEAFAKANCPAHYCGAIGGDEGLAALALTHLQTSAG